MRSSQESVVPRAEEGHVPQTTGSTIHHKPGKNSEMNISRRKALATTGGALLAATGLPALANEGRDKRDADVLYGHGMVWNRDLPGVPGELRLSFDLRVNLETGTGFGSANDPVLPDWNTHFVINSTQREGLPRGESRYTMIGVDSTTTRRRRTPPSSTAPAMAPAAM